MFTDASFSFSIVYLDHKRSEGPRSRGLEGFQILRQAQSARIQAFNPTPSVTTVPCVPQTAQFVADLPVVRCGLCIDWWGGEGEGRACKVQSFCATCEEALCDMCERIQTFIEFAILPMEIFDETAHARGSESNLSA
jgi:hypothetical protein